MLRLRVPSCPSWIIPTGGFTMSKFRGVVGLVLAALALFCLGGDALLSTAQQIKTTPGGPPKQAEKKVYAEDEIIQEFPAAGIVCTAWKIRYVAINPGPGLVITGAWLKTAPEEDWLKVIDNIRLSEIFVPYNNGTRIYDIGSQGNYSLLKH